MSHLYYSIDMHVLFIFQVLENPDMVSDDHKIVNFLVQKFTDYLGLNRGKSVGKLVFKTFI